MKKSRVDSQGAPTSDGGAVERPGPARRAPAASREVSNDIADQNPENKVRTPKSTWTFKKKTHSGESRPPHSRMSADERNG